MKKIIFALLLASIPLFPLKAVYAAPDKALYQELVASGRTDGIIIMVHDVPCLKVNLHPGEAVYQLCRAVPQLNKNYLIARDRISFLNRVNIFYQAGTRHSYGSRLSALYVPLDLKQEPRIFKEYENSFARFEKYILIDLSKEYLGIYEQGLLVGVFPISGNFGKTPLISFRVLGKEKNHYSSRYNDAWMPWSVHIHGHYFIHGGVLPGYNDSRGCIRLFHFNGADKEANSRSFYDWVKVGTPGKIVR